MPVRTMKSEKGREDGGKEAKNRRNTRITS
jgi:hypothetical protein